MLLSCLDPSHSWVVQTAAGDFIKAIITISANASQNEQQCIGPNELTRQLVSKPCVEQLVGYMLRGGNPLTVGVGIIIEVIRKNNSDYDPEVGGEANTVPSSRDPIYLGTLLRHFADNVPNFMSLIMDGPLKKHGLASTFGEKLEPLGFDRFKTCELMAELLHCSNMGLLNEAGSEQLIATRDAERNRLRFDGKLGPQRDEDQSADDLTMRIPQTATDESRRLEVTNADDDGFEEVEPSKEMSEDTSHEFVKAEDDMAAPPPASFLERDDDDFVDEPLNSPQVSFDAGKPDDPQSLDDPDLAVAPLSPSKARPVANEITESHDPQETSEVVSGPLPASTPKSGSDGLAPGEAGDSKASRELSPHPEDTPAPLFSPSNAGQPGAQQPAANATPTTPSEPHRRPATEEVGVAQEDLTTEPLATELRKDSGSVDPVVGDFLKMQFVEHHVVPAILVGLSLPGECAAIFVESNTGSPSSSPTRGTTSCTT